MDVVFLTHVIGFQSCSVTDQLEQCVGTGTVAMERVTVQMTQLIQFAFIQILCLCLSLRGPASDQPDHEGAFRGSVCVAGEAAGGAGLPGEQAGGGSGSHGDADPPKPGDEQEAGGGGEDRGSPGRLAGEGVTLTLLFVLFVTFWVKAAESQCYVLMFIFLF